MVALNKLFAVEYGNQFDLNKMKTTNDEQEMKKCVNFVGRTAKNLGVTAKVKKKKDVEPYGSGLITVALGGSILSSFVQPENFYTAQNVMVLTPLKTMTFQEKIYYCTCIEKNIFKYSTYGREANRTLKTLDVPKKVPKWTSKINVKKHLTERLKKEINKLLK